MADGGYGPDPFLKGYFWREAQSGPTAQDLEKMTAPFGGSPEQAMSLLQSPEIQQHLQKFGLGGLNPSMIRQSPFLPNQLMQKHPMLGGMLNNAMANVAATPEAPLVSGAGSGMSRAMQGLMGGPELLRQYQVRQMMAPFQAMGMQLPMQAEERRQQLLQDLEQDMRLRREAELQKTPADKIRDDVYSPPGAPGYFTRGQDVPQQIAGQTPEQSGMASHPLFNLFAPQGQDQGKAFPQSGQAQFHPYDPSQVKAFSEAKDPQKAAQAKWRQEQIDAGVPEAEVDKMQAQAEQARQGKGAKGGKDQAYWEKRYQDMDEKISGQIRAYEAAIQDPKATEEQKNLYKMQIDQLNQQREQEKAQIDSARGTPGASKPYQPQPRYNPNPSAMPPNSPGNKPTAQVGGAQQGGVGAQQSQGTAVQKPDYVY